LALTAGAPLGHSAGVPHTVHTGALHQAAEVLGGNEALRAYLHVTAGELAGWMDGVWVPPTWVFLQVADLLHEHHLKAILV
jgi:hypothetical protein